MKKLTIMIGVIVVLLAIVLVRAFKSGDALPDVEVKQYLQCSDCGARYEVPDNFLMNLKPEDIELGPGGVKLFRCSECGALAASPEIIQYIDGEKVE
jgi:hypothetical protein